MELENEHGSVDSRMVVACYLILQGASKTVKNKSGNTALERHPLPLSMVEKYVADKRIRGAAWIKEDGATVNTEESRGRTG